MVALENVAASGEFSSKRELYELLIPQYCKMMGDGDGKKIFTLASASLWSVMDDGGDAILDFGFGERRSFSELLFGVTRLKLKCGDEATNRQIYLIDHRSSLIVGWSYLSAVRSVLTCVG